MAGARAWRGADAVLSAASDRSWGVWLAIAPAGLWLLGSSSVSYCDSQSSFPSSTTPAASLTSSAQAGTPSPSPTTRLLQWLQLSGADVSALSIRNSHIGSSEGSKQQQQSRVGDAGLGLYLSDSCTHLHQRSTLRVVWDWINRSTAPLKLAEFPLSNALTAETAVQDRQLGAAFQRLLEQDVLNERTAVMVLLLIEKMKGNESFWAPWISILPTKFDTPLYWDEQDMKQLRGTTLSGASDSLKRRVTALWAELQPLVQDMLKSIGINEVPQLDDWLWAYSTFWSRAQSIPLSLSDGSSVVLEGIVPGLDFCNHSPNATCWWETSRRPEGKGSGALQLLTSSRHVPKPGQELLIDYGGKSNEELLMLYGFTLAHNPHDMVMVQCPVPPIDSWNAATRARMQLLQSRGLQPQFFLPSPDAAPSTAPPGHPQLPSGVREVLEVLVMDERQLIKELEADDEDVAPSTQSTASSAPSAPSSSPKPINNMTHAELQDTIASLSLDMAVLSSLVSLLQLKMNDLEGPDGTGTLEKDESVFKRGPASFTRPRKWQALVYRLQQKVIVRYHLKAASSQLQSVVVRLQELIAAEGKLSSRT